MRNFVKIHKEYLIVTIAAVIKGKEGEGKGSRDGGGEIYLLRYCKGLQREVRGEVTFKVQVGIQKGKIKRGVLEGGLGAKG